MVITSLSYVVLIFKSRIFFSETLGRLRQNLLHGQLAPLLFFKFVQLIYISED